MNRTMAKRSSRESDGNESRQLLPVEQGGLSARMRELILGFNVEERRKRRQGDNELFGVFVSLPRLGLRLSRSS